MLSHGFGSCVAKWNGRRLVLGNDRFLRVWSWREGQLFPIQFEMGRAEWIATEGTELGAAPVPPGNSLFPGEPEFQVSENDGGPVGEPYLHVQLVAGEVTYEFRIWEGIAGCAARVHFPGSKAARVETGTAAELSGVEVDEPVATTLSGEVDVQERFVLSPQAHFRLLAPLLFDQTDGNAELVQEREWLLNSRQWEIGLAGNVFALEEVLSKSGLLFVKHCPLPHSRHESAKVDFRVKRGAEVALLGHGAASGEGDWWGVFGYENGAFGRVAALQSYQRKWRRYEPSRDGLFLANTWGDRSRDAHLSLDFMTREVEAAAKLGVDVVQIDDGWQRGTTANSAKAKENGGVWNGFWASDANFWDVHEERFPSGLSPLLETANEHGMRFGLWFAPDSSGDMQNWEQDAGAILRHHRELGVNFFKIDALKLESKLVERRARAFINRVLEESEGAVTFDQDITAEDRFGYFGFIEPGPLFVENRYTDWHGYWPHYTLRVAWKLAHWVDPVRLRLEWLNVARNGEKYAGDPLAPVRWRPDALFATVMFFAPLGWFEVQNLPLAYFDEAAPLIAKWKAHREAIHSGTIRPIGATPDGVEWTGFVSWGDNGGYVLVFRELNDSSTWQVALPSNRELNCEVLGGRGSAQVKDGVLSVEVPEALEFLWVKVS